MLVEEVIEWLGAPGHVLDATLGGGGHSEALLHHGWRVTAVDRDPDAIRTAGERLAAHAARGEFRAIHSNYAALPDDGERFNGVLLDLGVSSHQFDDDARGFSYRRGSVLDMRMDTSVPGTAAEWLNESDEKELAAAFRTLADEPKARRLAREIIKRRATEPFATSDQFVSAIRTALGAQSGPSDFSRLFQAARVVVNRELEGLQEALPALRDRLHPAGRLAVISYHSGEDRLVKHAFREWSRACTCPPRLPLCACGGTALGEVCTRKAVTAVDAEVALNPRARSARLRVWQRAA